MFSLLKTFFLTFQLLGIPCSAHPFGGRAVESACSPFEIISHFVNRSLEALRGYEIVSECLSVIMPPEAKC